RGPLGQDCASAREPAITQTTSAKAGRNRARGMPHSLSTRLTSLRDLQRAREVTRPARPLAGSRRGRQHRPPGGVCDRCRAAPRPAVGRPFATLAPRPSSEGRSVARSLLRGGVLIFKETGLAGAFEIELERIADARGFFARAFCAREFEDQGLAARFV